MLFPRECSEIQEESLSRLTRIRGRTWREKVLSGEAFEGLDLPPDWRWCRPFAKACQTEEFDAKLELFESALSDAANVHDRAFLIQEIHGAYSGADLDCAPLSQRLFWFIEYALDLVEGLLAGHAIPPGVRDGWPLISILAAYGMTDSLGDYGARLRTGETVLRYALNPAYHSDTDFFAAFEVVGFICLRDEDVICKNIARYAFLNGPLQKGLELYLELWKEQSREYSYLPPAPPEDFLGPIQRVIDELERADSR